jgi:shikimate kinase
MSVETQIERIESLEAKSLKKRFISTIRDSGKEFMEGRNILYENNNFTVETDNKSVEEICYEIDRFLDE